MTVDEQKVIGAVTHPSTEPGYLDLFLSSSGTVRILIPDVHNAMLYVCEGRLAAGDDEYRPRTAPPACGTGYKSAGDQR